MIGVLHARIRELFRLFTQSLSGRLLLLTLLYVLLTETLLFAPSVGAYHRQLLDDHIQSAELAILPFTEPGGDSLSAGMRTQLLKRAGADAVVLKRADQKQFFLVDQMPWQIDKTIDITRAFSFSNMINEFDCLFHGGRRMLHVTARTQIKGAQSIGIILGEVPIYIALAHYAERELLISLILSITTAVAVFLSLYFVFVRPMSNITRAMVAFRENPEDPARIVRAGARMDEIGIAERELQGMQRDIYGFLQQKTRLAALGAAVARIQHDLRNILANAQLASDRLTTIEDPLVKRLTPRLVASLDRAVSLATSTLRYGRADERAPERKRIALKPLFEEAGESVVAEGRDRVRFSNGIDPELIVNADPDQLYRMILNLVRNAAQALEAAGGDINVSAACEAGKVSLDIRDTGPGIPAAVRENLFQPFASAARPGGSGLGLAIARDLARGHGGDIVLVATSEQGTHFRILISGWPGVNWDPKHYLTFADERTRPAADLVARIDAVAPKRIIDLGCGPGNSTAIAAACWPDAEVEGLDNSPEMIESANASGIRATFAIGDIAAWTPQAPYDVIFSNATFQWLGDHEGLLPRLAGFVNPGGTFAFQVPHNQDAPSHALMRETAASGPWSPKLRNVREISVLSVEAYYGILAGPGRTLDIWETEYLHVLAGEDPVYRWVGATGLRPFVQALAGAERDAFTDAYRARLRDAYPRRADGTTLFPFRRLFAVVKMQGSSPA